MELHRQQQEQGEQWYAGVEPTGPGSQIGPAAGEEVDAGQERRERPQVTAGACSVPVPDQERQQQVHDVVVRQV